MIHHLNLQLQLMVLINPNGLGMPLNCPPFMQKTFCDICGCEITTPTSVFFTISNFKQDGKTNNLNIKIITGKNEQEGEGDFCLFCVIDTIKDLDSRPICNS